MLRESVWMLYNPPTNFSPDYRPGCITPPYGMQKQLLKEKIIRKLSFTVNLLAKKWVTNLYSSQLDNNIVRQKNNQAQKI